MGNSSVVAQFSGIVIIMYPLNHYPPHFHAHYAEYQATYLIQDGTLLVGKMPNHQARKIAAWYNRHQEELATNWERIRRGEYPETMGDE